MQAKRSDSEHDVRTNEVEPKPAGPTDIRGDVEVCGISWSDLQEFEGSELVSREAK